MELVTDDDFNRFLKNRKTVTIADKQIPIGNSLKVTVVGPSKNYVPESETVWSFPDRGTWATHNGNYRGNWSPYIPRNLILKYRRPKDLVLDQMVGSGTTLVECNLLGRNAIGVDINREAIMVARDRLRFTLSEGANSQEELAIKTYVGDARNLNVVDAGSVDLIATHPPYAGIISYTKNTVAGDLSVLGLPNYLNEMEVVARESFRVLKPNKICAVLIGDTRKHLHYVPISLGVLGAFLGAGFVLKEDIIKLQHNTLTARENWRGKDYEFYKIAHEHLYIFRKPAAGESLSPLKLSLKWW